MPVLDWVEALSLEAKGPPEFFTSLSSIEGCEPPPSQAHSMVRAWQELGLSAILCCGTTPTVYFIESDAEIAAAETRRLQRKLWNHGVAPLLLLISPREVRAYSGLFLPAAEEEQVDSQHRLVRVFDRIADALALRRVIRTVESGTLFLEHRRSFDPAQRVDKYLLGNIDAARRLLLAVSDDLSPTTVHALLGRTVFACYLADRQVIGPQYFAQLGIDGAQSILDVVQAGNTGRQAEEGWHLYTLFRALQRDFNGDLFAGDLDEEASLIRRAHIKILARFLRGEDLDTGQTTLGFWAYDFSVIPVETISGIYEHFLNAEDSEGRRSIGAYYTPRFLAEVVLDVALAGWGTLLDKRVLDPSCGSGIFLVAMFNRVAYEWRRKNPHADNAARASGLINLIRSNLFGVDANETACRIAAFGLYLALLDQLSPRDIQSLQANGGVLPRLVASRDITDDAGQNIVPQNFFDDDLPLPDGDLGFDLVIGNPPWAAAKGARKAFERWCEARDMPLANRQIAQAFAWKAPTQTRTNGRVCLLLPAAILFNHNDRAIAFQERWIAAHRLESVVNLADMRFYLFEGAVRPTVVIRYGKGGGGEQAHVQYNVPKSRFESLYAEVITVSDRDRVYVRLREVLSDLRAGVAPSAWKQAMWGSQRDWKLLDRLRDIPTLGELMGPPKEQKRWVVGQGFQPQNESDRGNRFHERSWSSNDLFIEGKGRLDLVLTRSDCRAFGADFLRLRRLPDQRLFKAPHLVVSKGLRVAYAGFDVAFRHALQGIHGKRRDGPILRFLAAVLDSKLAKYFFFHTSASWGVERDEVHLAELHRLPFQLPSTARQEQIARECADLVSQLGVRIERNPLTREEALHNAREGLLDRVLEYYDIDEQERCLLEDTVDVWIPSATPRRLSRKPIPALRQSYAGERRSYLDVILKTVNELARPGKSIVGRVVVSTAADLGVVILSKARQSKSAIAAGGESDSTSELDEVLHRLRFALGDPQGSIEIRRGLKVYDKEQLYLVKPLELRAWTRTSALNDADEIAGDVLRRKRRPAQV